MQVTPTSEVDLKILELQLGRVPRGVLGIAARCVCGAPLVVATAPRLENGSPFPTMFYLTHPTAVKGCSVLESNQWMEYLNELLSSDEDLKQRYEGAHRAYIEAREAVEVVEEIKDFSAGGMPERVKCLHALLGHSLAAGRGVNPIGDMVRDRLAEDGLWNEAECSCLAGQTPADFEGEAPAEGDASFPWLEEGPAGRVAAIDCGTNSIRLLIGEMKDGEFEQHLRTMDIVRLGEGVDRTGRLSDEAIARTTSKAAEYGQVARAAGVNRMRFVATSASRDAENREEFRAGIRKVLGVEPEVVEGLEEAALSFSGAVGSLEDAPAPVMVVDIGGGSTEFVLGAGNEILASVSKNMGSVRITEKFSELSGANPSTQAAAAWVDSILEEAAAEVSFESVNTLVGVAGTVTTITCHALGLEEWDPVAVHGATISLEQMLASCDYMINAPAEELAALAYMPQGRADVISGGALIWRQILVRAAGANPELREVRVSEHDILDGIALSLLN